MHTQSNVISAAIPSFKTLAKVAAGFVLLVISSKISFQIGPVPLTMQTCAIGLLGALLGARLGFITTLSFVLAALAGLPILATPLTGFAALMGPTGGYLVAFPFGCAIAGFLAERGWCGTRVFASFITQFATNIFIVIFGGLWLMVITGVESAFTVGLIPFVLPSVTKSILAAAILAGIKIVKG